MEGGREGGTIIGLFEWNPVLRNWLRMSSSYGGGAAAAGRLLPSRSLSRQYADVGGEGGREGRRGGIFSIAPSSSVPSFVRHRSQFMLLGWGLDGVRSEDEEGAGSRDGSTRTAIEGTPAPPTLVKPIVGDSTV